MVNDQLKLNLLYNAKGEQFFELKLLKKNKNCFELNQEKSEVDLNSTNKCWVILLFAGWSGYDIISLKFLIDLSEKFPDVNFGLKVYNEVDKIKEFSSSIKNYSFTPILIGRLNNSSRVLNIGPMTRKKAFNVISDFVSHPT